MTLLPDGRYALEFHEIDSKIWLKLKNFRLENPNAPMHLIPDFPECPHRSMQADCKPCGAKSRLNYECSKKKTLVSPSYCKGCVELGENL